MSDWTARALGVELIVNGKTKHSGDGTQYVAELITERRVRVQNEALYADETWEVSSRRIMGLYRAPGMARSQVTRHVNRTLSPASTKEYRMRGTVYAVVLELCPVVRFEKDDPAERIADAERILESASVMLVAAQKACADRSELDQQRVAKKASKR